MGSEFQYLVYDALIEKEDHFWTFDVTECDIFSSAQYSYSGIYVWNFLRGFTLLRLSNFVSNDKSRTKKPHHLTSPDSDNNG